MTIIKLLVGLCAYRSLGEYGCKAMLLSDRSRSLLDRSIVSS